MRSTFMLQIQVDGPLGMLLPPVAAAKYGALFRLHWDLATASADLDGISRLHRRARRLPKTAAALTQAEGVRGAMRHTVGVLRLHLATATSTHALQAQTAAFAAARTIEQAAAAHEDCLEALLRGAFLSGRPGVLRRVDGIRRAASSFAEMMTSRLDAIDAMRSSARLTGKPRTDRHSEHATAAATSLELQLTGASFEDTVAEAGSAFTDLLDQLICELADSHSAAQAEGVLPKAELVALQNCIEALLGGNNCVLRQGDAGTCSNSALASALMNARLGPRNLLAAQETQIPLLEYQ